MITLNELLLHEELKEITFLTDNEHLNKEVKEITVMEVPEVCKWLNGNELVITSLYAVKDNIESQLNLIEDLSKVSCSGLLIKCGPHVKCLDEEVILKAEELEIPILLIPEKMTYVHIIGHVMRIIARKEEDTITVENILFKLASGNELTQSERVEVERVFKIKDIDDLYFCFLVEYDEKQLEEVFLEENNIYKIHIGDSNLFFIIDKDRELIKRKRENIKTLLSKIEINSILYLGNIINGISKIQRDLKEISLLINEVKGYKSFPQGIYSKKGLEEELIKKNYILTSGKNFYSSYLKNLSDEEIETLEAFIKNSFNVVETSKELFLHKNTVRYRLNSVSEKTGLDPFSFEDAIKIYYAIKYLKES